MATKLSLKSFSHPQASTTSRVVLKNSTEHAEPLFIALMAKRIYEKNLSNQFLELEEAHKYRLIFVRLFWVFGRFFGMNL